MALLNGWRLIGKFDPSEFEGDQFFLVWMQDPQSPAPDAADEWPEMAQWVVADGVGKFEGTWRHIDEMMHLEPVAFKGILPPYSTFSDGGEEKEIPETFGTATGINPPVNYRGEQMVNTAGQL